MWDNLTKTSNVYFSDVAPPPDFQRFLLANRSNAHALAYKMEPKSKSAAYRRGKACKNISLNPTSNHSALDSLAFDVWSHGCVA